MLRSLISLVLITVAAVLSGCADSDGPNGGAPDPSVPILNFPVLNESRINAETGDISFPDALAALDGKEVSIAGFMAPYDKLDDMSLFMLMPSYVGCYFCKPPALNQVLYVEQSDDPDEKPQFEEKPIRVTGTLRIFSPESEHPAHLAEFVYALDDAEFATLDGNEAFEKAKATHTLQGMKNPAHAQGDPPGGGKNTQPES